MKRRPAPTLSARPELVALARTRTTKESFQGDAMEPGLGWATDGSVLAARRLPPSAAVQRTLDAPISPSIRQPIARASIALVLDDALQGAFPVAFEGMRTTEHGDARIVFVPSPPLGPAAQAALAPDRPTAAFDRLSVEVRAARLAFVRDLAGPWEAVLWGGPEKPVVFLAEGVVIAAVMPSEYPCWATPLPPTPDERAPATPWARTPWPARARPLDPEALAEGVVPAEVASWAVAGGGAGVPFVGTARLRDGIVRFAVHHPHRAGEDFGTGGEGLPWEAFERAFVGKSGAPPSLYLARLEDVAVAPDGARVGRAPLPWSLLTRLALVAPFSLSLDPAYRDRDPKVLVWFGGAPFVSISQWHMVPLETWRAAWAGTGFPEGVWAAERVVSSVSHSKHDRALPGTLGPLAPEVLAWRPDGRTRLQGLRLTGGAYYASYARHRAEDLEGHLQELSEGGPGLMARIRLEWITPARQIHHADAWVEVSTDGSLWQHAGPLHAEYDHWVGVRALAGGVRPLSAWLAEVRARATGPLRYAQFVPAVRVRPVDVARGAPSWTGEVSPEETRGVLSPEGERPTKPTFAEGERLGLLDSPAMPLFALWDVGEQRLLAGGVATEGRARALIERHGERLAKLEAAAKDLPTGRRYGW